MNFDEILAQAVELLRQEHRVSYRALQRRLRLDSAMLEDLKAEIIEAKRLATDEHGSVLVWAGSTEQTIPSTNTEPAISPAIVPAERRQLTVMFCDLVGSTQLAQRMDPEELAAIIQDYDVLCAGVVARFGGYVGSYLGDGVLAYFGYPLAHEDDAQRAVEAGLAIVSALKRQAQTAHQPLQARVGIHTGLVVVSEMEIGAGRDQTTVLGESPSLAARIQQAAEPDSVVISAATHRLVRGSFSCESMGPHQFKGISRAVEIYRVAGETGVESRFQAATSMGLTPLVGLHEELDLVLQRWRLSSRGKGQVVAISGEAGIGKSRLLYEARQRVIAAGGVPLDFHCSPYHENSAYHPVIQFLRRLLRFAPNEAPEEKFAKLATALKARSFPDSDTLPLLASLLSIPLAEGFTPPALSPQKQRERTLAALIAWIRETAEQAPVCVVFEDLQWADPSTLELLGQFLGEAQAMRVLILLTFRPEFVPPQPGGLSIIQLALNRMEREDARRIIDGVTGGKGLPDEVLRAILDKTDGIPLFLEELTKAVIESGALRPVGDHFELNGQFSPLAVPTTVHDSLMARLDRLGRFKEVAQLGAMLGREFSQQLIQAVSPLDEATLRQGLDKLVDAQLLYRRRPNPHVSYLFKHALIQEAAYQSILRSKRQQYHRHIAQVLEQQFSETVQSQPELVAHHYTEADIRPAAIRYRQMAADKAVRRSANLEAISHLRKALDLLEGTPDTPERAHQELTLQIALGAPLMATTGFASPEAEKVYARARQLCLEAGESPQLFPVIWGLWVFYTARARHEVALEMGEQCLNIAQRANDPALLLEAHHALGVTFLSLGEFARAQRHLEEVITSYDPDKHAALAYAFGQDSRVVCLSHGAWTLWFLGYPDQARSRNEEAIALARRIDHPYSLAAASAFAACLYQIVGEDGPIRGCAESAIGLSADLQSAFWMHMGVILRGWALTRQREVDQGVAQIRAGLNGFEATSAEIMKPYFLALLAEALGRSGKADDGLALLGEALSLVERSAERWCEAELHRLTGELILKRGSVSKSGDAAEPCFRRALAIARSQNARSLELRAAISLSRLLIRQANTIEARSLLQGVYGWFKEGFDTPDLREAKDLLAQFH